LMILNRFEYALMNNPIRASLQRAVVAKRLLALGGPCPGGSTLEIGCGRGVGIEIILDLFGAERVDAFDLDPRMIARAEYRHRDRARQVTIRQGDATQIAVADEHYDAVFDFGIIHHVVPWQQVLSEVYRVLKPGGQFYAEEVYARVITHWFWRRVLDHPQVNRFDHNGFIAALNEMGFEKLRSQEFCGCLGWFAAVKPKKA
jgi:ubiquinone/menaquinone biosynthesis C-methylase UbiE